MDNVTVDADFSLQSAVLYGLAEPIDFVTQQVNFTCPTGNCSWDPFESLAMCSICKNVTERMAQADGTSSVSFDFLERDNALAVAAPMTSYHLPNGL